MLQVRLCGEIDDVSEPLGKIFDDHFAHQYDGTKFKEDTDVCKVHTPYEEYVNGILRPEDKSDPIAPMSWPDQIKTITMLVRKKIEEGAEAIVWRVRPELNSNMGDQYSYFRCAFVKLSQIKGY